MARKTRICLPELTYHIMSRCIEGKHLIKPEKMKELMLQVLRLALEKYCFELISYTIMDNHFHFIIRTLQDGESISRIMQFIKSQFARRYNRLTDRIGPFWNERFSDTIIELSNDPVVTFFTILFYIAFNPVKIKIVADPRDYVYSSIMCYLDENFVSPVEITLHKYFFQLGDFFAERKKKLLEYEEMCRKRIFPGCLFT